MATPDDDRTHVDGPYDRLRYARRARATTTAALIVLAPFATPYLLNGFGAVSPTPNFVGPVVLLSGLVGMLVLFTLAERHWRRVVKTSYSSDLLRSHAPTSVRIARRCALGGYYLAGLAWAISVVSGDLGADLRVIAVSTTIGEPLRESLVTAAVLLAVAAAAVRGLINPGEPEVVAIERAAALRARVAGFGTAMDPVVDDLARRIDSKLSKLDEVGGRLREVEARRQLLADELRPAVLSLMQDAQRRTARSGVRLQILFFVLGLIGGILVNYLSKVIFAI